MVTSVAGAAGVFLAGLAGRRKIDEGGGRAFGGVLKRVAEAR